MKALLGLFIVVAMVSPLCADSTILTENFSGTLNASVAGWNGWTGDSNLKISSTTIDSGYSAVWSSGTPELAVYKTYSYTPVAGEQYVFTATLKSGDDANDISGVVLTNAGETRSFSMYVYQNRLSFNDGLNYFGASHGKYKDVKAILTSNGDAYCFHRNHGDSTWIFAGVLQTGRAPSTYDRVKLDIGCTTGSGIDSISLTTEGASLLPEEGEILFKESFEGTVGTHVHDWNGWSSIAGNNSDNIVISSTTVSSGNSAGWTAGTTWPGVTHAFSYTPSAQQYVLTGTLNAPNTSGDYADLRLVTSGGNYVAACLGYNTLYFNDDEAYNIGIPQSTTMDVKMIFTEDSKVQCYYRNHASAGNVLLQENFDGTAGNQVNGWNGWSGDSNIVISGTTIDSGNSVAWTAGTTWPKVTKTFSYTPTSGVQYELTATLNAPNTSGDYADLRLVTSGGNYVAAQLGYNTLYFSDDGAGNLSISQSTTMDVKMIFTYDGKVACYYRNHGATTWNCAGVITTNHTFSSYTKIDVVGHGGYAGKMDSIKLEATGWTYAGVITTNHALSSYTKIAVWGHGGYQGKVDSIALAATSSISHGRQVILNRGLQMPLVSSTGMGLDQDDIDKWWGLNFTGIEVLTYGDTMIPDLLEALPENTQWTNAPYIGDVGDAGEPLTTAELPYAESYVGMMYGDELADLMSQYRLDQSKIGYSLMRSLYPNALAFTAINGSASYATIDDLTTYMQYTKPDLVAFDMYFNDVGQGTFTFGEPQRRYWYSLMQRFRTAALAGNDGTGQQPIAYGQWLSLYRHSLTGDLPSESFIRAQQFVSWTLGFTYLSGFDYIQQAAVDSYTVMADGSWNPTVAYTYVADANTMSKYLGPALIRLKNTDVRMKAGTGRLDLSNIVNCEPIIPTWSANNTGCSYITNITPRGANNVDNPASYCDWVIGHFQPLKASNTDNDFVNGGQYFFMITNGDGGAPVAYDGAGAVAASALAQYVRIDFDFGASGYNCLMKKLRTGTGTQVIDTEGEGWYHDTGAQYHLILQLDGGTGDLFRLYQQ